MEKFKRLIMLLKELDKTTYLLIARISFGRTALHRKLTFPRVFSTFYVISSLAYDLVMNVHQKSSKNKSKFPVVIKCSSGEH